MKSQAVQNSDAGIKKRQHIRFEVTGGLGIEGATHEGPLGEVLVSFSEGGCGFVCPAEDFKLQVKQSVVCHFFDLNNSKEYFVRGEVTYIQPHPLPGHTIGRVYGIKFFESERSKVEPILHYLMNV